MTVQKITQRKSVFFCVICVKVAASHKITQITRVILKHPLLGYLQKFLSLPAKNGRLRTQSSKYRVNIALLIYM